MWARLGRGFLALGLVLLPMAASYFIVPGFAFFGLVVYMLPGYALGSLVEGLLEDYYEARGVHSRVPSEVASYVNLGVAALQTLLLAWWLGGARGRWSLARRCLAAAIPIYLATWAFLLILAIGVGMCMGGPGC